MRKITKLKDLTLKHNFMFGAVMSDPENCRGLLELVLKFPIESVEVSKEKSLFYHPEYKGVRLDIYAKDEHNTHYNIEMQSVPKTALSKRSRYYHSQIDMELLRAGRDYSELSDAYVIFLCDFDPFGEGKYCYTFENTCREVADLHLGDGTKSIFLSTIGENPEDVPEELVSFLKYLGANLEDSQKYFGEGYVKSIQQAVQDVKNDRSMEEQMMTLEEWLQDERELACAEGRAEGRAEFIVELLELQGKVSEELKERIRNETDITLLRHWALLLLETKSVEEFEKRMEIK